MLEKENCRLSFPHTSWLHIIQRNLNLHTLPNQIIHGLHAWRHTSFFSGFREFRR